MNEKNQRYISKQDEHKFKIILVGDSNVGKTALFTSFTEGEQFSHQKNTKVTTVDFRIKNLQVQSKEIKLYIWDTAGQQRYRAIVSTYFKGCHGIVIVFDLTSKNSYLNATQQWYNLCMQKVPKASIVLVGNKTDLVDLVEVKEKQIKQWCQKVGTNYFLTSVKLGQNINSPFIQLSKNILENSTQTTSSVSEKTSPQKEKEKIKLNKKKNKSEKKKCC